jgi:hypothetical protein
MVCNIIPEVKKKNDIKMHTVKDCASISVGMLIAWW